MLDLFQRRDIRATWATVGALLCESKDELLARAEHAAGKGAAIPRLEDIGPDERRDPYHFGASLARLIASCPGQEIGTHTFSHRCALEPGETLARLLRRCLERVGAAPGVGDQLQVDRLSPQSVRPGAARGLPRARIKPLSRQRGEMVLCPGAGERADQSAPPMSSRRQLYRPLRPECVAAERANDGPLINVASSRFLRPFSRRFSALDGLRMRRIEKAMEEAATPVEPFIYGGIRRISARTSRRTWAILTKVLDRFQRLRDEYGMQSRAMCEVANRGYVEDDATRGLAHGDAQHDLGPQARCRCA